MLQVGATQYRAPEPGRGLQRQAGMRCMPHHAPHPGVRSQDCAEANCQRCSTVQASRSMIAQMLSASDLSCRATCRLCQRVSFMWCHLRICTGQLRTGNAGPAKSALYNEVQADCCLHTR